MSANLDAKVSQQDQVRSADYQQIVHADNSYALSSVFLSEVSKQAIEVGRRRSGDGVQ